MAENIINNTRKKSQLFLNNLAPVSNTYNELIKEKLMCGQFPLTKTGYIKILAILILLMGLALFLGLTVCVDAPSWYLYIFPISVGINIFVQLLLYIIFAFGATVKNPGRWVKTDIMFNFIASVIGIIGSTLAITECKNGGTIHQIPGSLGIAGGIISIMGCGAIFLMYRYVKEEQEELHSDGRNVNPRSSIHA